jgi:predicted site-specific integrase-resolvase
VNRLRVPEGVPRAVKISDFADALGVNVRTVRTWADAGRLKTLPTFRKCTRYIRAEELARLEAEGWPVRWEKLL